MDGCQRRESLRCGKMSDDRIIFLERGKPTQEQILMQLLGSEPFVSDEIAFSRHYLLKRLDDE